MKFVHYLEKINNVNVYALSAMGIFLFIFAYMLWYVCKGDKETFRDISRMPLD